MGNTEAPRIHSTKVQRVTVTKAKIEIKKKNKRNVKSTHSPCQRDMSKPMKLAGIYIGA